MRDLSWLLSRGYVLKSSLKLVGDRHELRERQRAAVSRSTSSDAACERRRERQVAPQDLTGQALWIDGFNVVNVLESALGGAPIFRGRESAHRDLAGVHGSWRRVEETLPAIAHLVSVVEAHAPSEVQVLLDRPVSNSGRLATFFREATTRTRSPWTITVDDHVDRQLIDSGALVLSSDGIILERATGWTDLFDAVMAEAAHTPWRLDLRID